jgi:hypothetical protein
LLSLSSSSLVPHPIGLALARRDWAPLCHQSSQPRRTTRASSLLVALSSSSDTMPPPRSCPMRCQVRLCRAGPSAPSLMGRAEQTLLCRPDGACRAGPSLPLLAKPRVEGRSRKAMPISLPNPLLCEVCAFSSHGCHGLLLCCVSNSEGPLKVAVELEPTTVACWSHECFIQ